LPWPGVPVRTVLAGSLALGGIAAMSSTAIASRMLAERGELDSPHGRQTLGVLLFQDLAVVPLLVLIPALAQPAGASGSRCRPALARPRSRFLGGARRSAD